MKQRQSLSPIGNRIQSIQFSCLRVEYTIPTPAEQIKVIVCSKYTFTSQFIQHRCAYFNQTLLLDVLNDKITIQVQPMGQSSIDLNTYQAFSLEKVPIYEQRQLIGFLCFKIEITHNNNNNKVKQTEQSINFGSNLFTMAFSEQYQLQQQQQQASNRLSYEDIKSSIDQISVAYDDLSRTMNYVAQQEQQLKQLDQEHKDQQEIIRQLNEQEADLDNQLKKYQQCKSPHLNMLLNSKLEMQQTILQYKKPDNKMQNIKSTDALTMSIPFSFNEYFSLYKN